MIRLELKQFNEEAGTFLRIHFEDGSWYAVPTSELSVIRKAVVDFREKQRDSFLEMSDRSNNPIAFVASSIRSFDVSSPESRLRSLIDEIRQVEWENDVRKEYALASWE